MNQQPIIVFDSGFGGISVLKRLIRRLPNENFLYLGDSANAPYGPRPREEVCDLTLRAIGSLMDHNPKAIVIACNTATAAAAEALQAKYPEIPVIGIVPAVVDAAADPDNHCVLALATAGTLASATFAAVKAEAEQNAEIIPVPAPGIVEYVEGEMKDREGVLRYLRELFRPWQDRHFDAVVLGCTHFPFAADVIGEALGYPVRFYDGGILTTRRTAEILEQSGAANDSCRSGSVCLINSAEQKDMLRFAWNLLASG